ncbi:MAG: hypothetical protein AB7F88_18910, partial [Pyrinomonadaceae bacterium]
SRARFRFVSGINRKPVLGLSQKRKLIGGQTIKKCQLFSGRVIMWHNVARFFEIRGTRRNLGRKYNECNS